MTKSITDSLEAVARFGECPACNEEEDRENNVDYVEEHITPSSTYGAGPKDVLANV
jgi:hypothetical protein